MRDMFPNLKKKKTIGILNLQKKAQEEYPLIYTNETYYLFIRQKNIRTKIFEKWK